METKRVYRNSDDKVIAGVASGIANYLNTDPVLIRIAFIIALFFGGLGLIAYIICWVLIPEKGETVYAKRKLYRNLDDNKMGGVAAGLGDFFAVDANIIRVLFVVTSFFGGAGIFIYLCCWIIIPSRPFHEKIDLANNES